MVPEAVAEAGLVAHLLVQEQTLCTLRVQQFKYVTREERSALKTNQNHRAMAQQAHPMACTYQNHKTRQVKCTKKRVPGKLALLLGFCGTFITYGTGGARPRWTSG